MINFFSKDEHSNVIACINTVLKRVDSLGSDQLLGLLAAAFTLGRTSWVRAI